MPTFLLDGFIVASAALIKLDREVLDARSTNAEKLQRLQEEELTLIYKVNAAAGYGEWPRGEAGYSDGDVLWHAVIDALLGAAGLGDIGTHFPPGDPAWKDADSNLLGAAAAGLLSGAGWSLGNLDCTVMLEAPRLSPYRDSIRRNLASVLGLDPDRVSVKAKSFEGFGEVGRGEAIEARAVALIVGSGPPLAMVPRS